MTRRPPLPLALATAATAVAVLALGACEGDAPEAPELGAASVHADAADASIGAAVDGAVEGGRDALAAVMGASEIPYPIYPNGSKYRVGGENGLKIVVFQTEDSFDEVDAYYRSVSADRGTPRLHAMADYVRYPSEADDGDPWATYRPGIVIHEFDGEEARRTAGATASARTNIIMSY